MKVATYLDFKDNAKVAIQTYQAIFGAEVVCEYFYDENMTQDQELLGKVFHAELKIGDLNLYLCDVGKAPSFPSMKFVVEIRDESEALHDFEKMPYGPVIAQAQDQFGIRWEVVIW